MRLFIQITLTFVSLAVMSSTMLIGQEKAQSHQIMYTQDWPQKDHFRFLQIADTQNPRDKDTLNHVQRSAIFTQLIEQLGDDADPVDLIIHSGDFVDHGGNEEQWQKYFDTLFWDHLNASQKQRFFPALGNHEYKPHFLGFLGSGNGNLKNYFARFTHLNSAKFYFFFFSNSCFVVLDSGNNGLGKLFGGEKWERDFKGQKEWLQEIVFPSIEQRTGIKNIFVIYHKCGYPTPIFQRNKNSSEILAMFEDLNGTNKNRYRVVALVGHIHTFSHMIKDFNSDGEAGVHQFCCGCGGGTQRGKKYFKKVEQISDLDLYRMAKYEMIAPNGNFDQAAFDSVRFDNNIFGYLEITVSESLLFQFHRYQSASNSFEVDYKYQFD